VPDSNSKFPLAAHSVHETFADGAASASRKRIRVVLTSVTLICVWLIVRFPYEAGSGLTSLLSGPNRVNPQTLHLRGEFVESNLGSIQGPGDEVTVRMIAEQYLFVPQCIVVPTGVSLRFRLTSADVVHKLTVGETGVEVTVVPGFVVETHLQFARAGVYEMPCHEFCGPGHYAMRSQLVAVSQEQFRNLSREARVSCASR
jgi:cytochrome c oxidase subunit II